MVVVVVVGVCSVFLFHFGRVCISSKDDLITSAFVSRISTMIVALPSSDYYKMWGKLIQIVCCKRINTYMNEAFFYCFLFFFFFCFIFVHCFSKKRSVRLYPMWTKILFEHGLIMEGNWSSFLFSIIIE